MDHLWIVASLAAALFQALRYAALKELNRHLSAPVTTYVRMLFGLPFLTAWLVGVLHWTGAPLPATNLRFWLFASLTAVLQFLMTLLVVRLFQLGNFAVGLMITRADVILTAIIGSIVFREIISPGGWLAIAVTVAGVLAASAGRIAPTAWKPGEAGLLTVLLGPATRIGLASALLAAISYLALKEAILALEPSVGPLVRSAAAGAAMTLVSFVIIGIWLAATELEELKRIRHWPWLCVLAGFASAAGTVGWFTASALANASYVAAVAQVQIAFALLISRYWFRERIKAVELVGIALILAGVLLFRLA
ncbi:MAG: DMT family transporter [Hyphomicrobiaceae bacterium]|nr:DMT family transporter [Hyphomicrobiaceae bacterium]